MTIKKFQGKTKEEAIQNAKNEFGDQVVIMNVKEIRKKGVLGVFQKSTFEVTAAIEDEIINRPSFKELTSQAARGNNFNAVVNDDTKPISNLDSNSAISELQRMSMQGNTSKEVNDVKGDEVNSDELKDAFKAVSEVINSGLVPTTEVKTMATYDRNGSVIKAGDVSKTVPNVKPVERPQIKQEAPMQATYSKPKYTAPSFMDIVEPEASEKKESNFDAKASQGFVKMLYKVLLANEVEEKYVNQLLDDMEKVLSGSNNLDYMLSNVYQKLVLMLGQPKLIQETEQKPGIILFIGPTGVGKTTTIAKLASKYKLEYGKKVALITSDTYRIAATDQLRTYADIIDAPLSIIYSPDDIIEAVENLSNFDFIFVDTAGFSHKNNAQKSDMKKMLDHLSEKYEKDVYLVLSATTKYRDLKEIIDTYKEFTDFHLIFTKIDETASLGNILNAKLYSNVELSYITNGQNVPDDIEEIDTQHLVKQLLGGH